MRAKIILQTNLIESLEFPPASEELPEEIRKVHSKRRSSNLVLTKRYYLKNEIPEKPSYKELTLTESEEPLSFELRQNYPNPFNPATQIAYQIPSEGLVRLEVFDLLGRKVQTLVNDVQEAGKYTVTFDAGGLASGVYFYRLSSGTFISSQKMFLLK